MADEIRNIACPICGNTTDNEGTPLGTIGFPPNTPEHLWAHAMAGYTCDRVSCAATVQATIAQNDAARLLSYRHTLLHDIFKTIQTDVASGKNLGQALADVMSQM